MNKSQPITAYIAGGQEVLQLRILIWQIIYTVC